MKKKVLLHLFHAILISFFLPRILFAVTFTDASAGIEAADSASLCWGDFDNDGDLDLAVSGNPASASRFTRIYRNDPTGFHDLAAGIDGVSSGALDWGDYDGDGDLDLGMMGTYDGGTNSVARIYRNDGGAFRNILAGLPNVYVGTFTWGDYDNDGDLDFELSGWDGASLFVSRIYRNARNTFVDSVSGLTGLYVSSLNWGDYDNDGDLDLAAAGSDGTNRTFRIWRNDNLVFVNATGANFTGEVRTSLAWGDYDNDGDIDILNSGFTVAGTYLNRVYRNDSGTFVNNSAITLPGVDNCFVAWADYDADGDLDISFAGRDSVATNISRIYQNNAGAFSDIVAGLTGVYHSSVRWGDYDNDGELDLALAGLGNGSTYNTILYNASGGTANTAPSAPSEMASSYSYSLARSTITFKWAPGQYDTGKSSHSLYYQIAVATATMSWDGVKFTSPSTFTFAWQNGSPLYGNYIRPAVKVWPGDSAPMHAIFFSTNTPALAPLTTYYWCVRTIDAGLMRSAWSAEQTIFTAPPAGTMLDINAGITAVMSGGLAWGDYDNDGDLDLAICGTYATAGTDISRIYTNNSGIFTGANIGIPVNESSVAWGDFDNDGDLDLALSGSYLDTEDHTRVYRNDGGGTFIHFSPGSIDGCYSCSTAWGDYDNDGDLDLAVCGFDTGVRARVYRNDRTTFVTATASTIPGVGAGELAWGDYDGDGDLDLALCGTTNDGTTKFSRVYKNTSGSFANGTGTDLIGVWNACLSWGDYDNDGDLDLALAGDSGTNIARIYRNDSTAFVIGASLTGVGYSSLAWGDYDNDGDLDLVSIGEDNSTNYITRLYQNDANTFVTVSAGLQDIDNGALAWGDYDNDGDLDLALAGEIATSNYTSEIFQSLEAQRGNENTPPSPPSGMTAKYSYAVAKSTIAFKWDPGQYDTGRSSNSLYYQIVVATNPTTWNGVKFTSPSKFSLPWQNGSPQMGNFMRPAAKQWSGDTTAKHTIYYSSASAVLTTNTTYYWRVRTIDAGLRRSAWSAEYSICTTSADVTAPAAISNLTAISGADNTITLSWTSPGDDGSVGSLSNALFRIKYSTVGILTSGNFESPPPGYAVTTVDISTNTTPLAYQTTTFSNLIPGVMYWFAVKTMDNAGNWSVWNSSADVSTINTLAWGVIDATPPGKVTGLVSASGAQVLLNWTAPGDDNYAGNVTGGQWRIDYSSVTVTPGETGGASVYSLIMSTNFTQGATYWQVLTGLVPRATYYFQVKAADERGNWCSLWSSSASVITGSFVDSNAALCGGLYEGGMSWGDYDNDGDLDIAVAGDNGKIASIYGNTTGSFSDITAGLSGVHLSALTWGDYDNDGDLDLAVAGAYDDTTSSKISRIYRNNGGSFGDSGAAITGVSCSALAWADYDNDGDLDLAITGTYGTAADGTDSLSRIYRNDRGTFADTAAGLTGVYWNNTELNWGDYDNDGDLDLALGGKTSAAELISRIYRNNAGSFEAVDAGLTGVFAGALSWGDYDNDGDLDLALSGRSAGRETRIFRNDSGSFHDLASAGMTGLSSSQLSWGDYDNDGDLDLAVAGWTGVAGEYISRIYRNDLGNDTNPFADINGGIPGASYGAIIWGDYDNDGDLDLALGGDGGNAVYYSKIYKSLEADFGNVNAVPSAPSGMSAAFTYSLARSTITFKWDPGQYDTGCSSNSLYYQIAVATAPMTWSSTKFISPSSFTFTWQNGSPLMGNYIRPAAKVWPGDTTPKHALFFSTNTPTLQTATTYYWQVRTIDAGLRRSLWSSENSIYTSTAHYCAPNAPAGLAQYASTTSWTAIVPGSWVNYQCVVATFTITDPYAPHTVQYNIQFSTYADFSYNYVSATAPATASMTQGSTYYVTPLLPDGTWFWRVRAMNNDGFIGAYSSMTAVNGRHFGIDATVPSSITTLAAVTGFEPGVITLSWTAPGDDGITNTITNGAYRIRYSTYVTGAGDFWTDASANWTDYQNKYQVQWATNTPPSTEHSWTLTGLTESATYYVRIWTRDEIAGSADWDGNWSGLSNGATTWAQAAIVAVEVKPDLAINFGSVAAGGSKVLASSFSVTNNGNVRVKYRLQLTNVPSCWSVKEAPGAPGYEQIKVLALFTTMNPPAVGDFTDDIAVNSGGDIVRASTYDIATSSNFAVVSENVSVKGYNCTVGAVRRLWFRFDAPSATVNITSQFVTVTATAIQY